MPSDVFGVEHDRLDQTSRRLVACPVIRLGESSKLHVSAAPGYRHAVLHSDCNPMKLGLLAQVLRPSGVNRRILMNRARATNVAGLAKPWLKAIPTTVIQQQKISSGPTHSD